MPNYELPINIPGLDLLGSHRENPGTCPLSCEPTNDVVIALTHIGFTENPKSVEVDANVDTNLVDTMSPGLDALVGRSQSHKSRDWFRSL